MIWWYLLSTTVEPDKHGYYVFLLEFTFHFSNPEIQPDLSASNVAIADFPMMADN